MSDVIAENPLQMKFEPRTIEHLGVRMYSTLPPALAEMISNSYDADAENVKIELHQVGSLPSSIVIHDDGSGMDLDDINDKFLVIGRNRRDETDEPSPVFGRKATGKKGLGKLALFGLAKKIQITSIKGGKKNTFTLDWDTLKASTGIYKPDWDAQNEDTDEPKGTRIKLSKLKRKTPFDVTGLANSLAQIFLFDDNFNLEITGPSGQTELVTNLRRYQQINEEFSWDEGDWDVENEDYSEVEGKIISSFKPISPKSGLRGITIFSRGKLVNAPEFFSESTSSHFYQYITGYIVADFIDEFPEDVISTNRQALDWEHPEMAKFREYLKNVVSNVGKFWRKKRKDKKTEEIKEATGGIDKEDWMSKLPEDIKSSANKILELLGGDESVETIAPVVTELHKIVPEYPHLHWRHLHDRLRSTVKSYYENAQYGEAAQQGCLDYLQFLRDMTGSSEDGRKLVDPIFTHNKTSNPPKLPNIQITALSTESEENIQEGHSHLSRGLVVGFRNPIQHAPMYTMVPDKFTEMDCLNILSLISYLMTRVDGATINP